MSSSLWSANRNTHLKIMAVSVAASIVVVIVGMSARSSDTTSASAHAQPDRAVVKAGKPAKFATGGTSMIR